MASTAPRRGEPGRACVVIYDTQGGKRSLVTKTLRQTLRGPEGRADRSLAPGDCGARLATDQSLTINAGSRVSAESPGHGAALLAWGVVVCGDCLGVARAAEYG